MVGNWEIKVSTSGMPQVVASAMSALGEKLMGAEYECIAYLGEQPVNGTNYAVLAKQTVVAGRDSENVVVLIFNKKPNMPEATLVGIERVVESGAALGGTKIDVTTDISDDLMNMWKEAFEGWLGMRITPFAFLGTQVTKGTGYMFAAEVVPVVREPKNEAVIVTINPMTKEVHMKDLLATKQEGMLGYAFTWLKNN